MRFQYVAYRPAGGVVRGGIDAQDAPEARTRLRGQGLRVLEMAPARHGLTLEELFPSLYKAGPGELIKFARHVSTMLASGGNLVRALEMARHESRNRLMRRTLGVILAAVSDGSSLTEAMLKHPKVFPSLFIRVVEVGEYTGRIAPSLEQLAAMLESEQDAKQRAIKTMMYPLAIVGLSMLTLTVLVLVAVPPLLKVFGQMGAELPLITRLAVGMINGAKANGGHAGLAVGIAIMAAILVRRVPPGRRWMDGALGRLPLYGPLMVAGDLARFSRTMHMLLDAGVSLDTALQLGGAGCNNIRIREAFAAAHRRLVAGGGVSAELRRHAILPSLFLELFSMGEDGNALPRMMGDAASAYQKQRDARLNALLGVLEPASTLVVGAIVGFIAFSMFIPIYSGLNAIG